ncbi:unnamed protein product, partial [Rotaria magnacalcarata]
ITLETFRIYFIITYQNLDSFRFNNIMYNQKAYMRYAPSSQLIPSPIYDVPKRTTAGGKTLPIIAGLIATIVLIGMGLGLGLGIGAAGLVSSNNLTVVTNTTV